MCNFYMHFFMGKGTIHFVRSWMLSMTFKGVNPFGTKQSLNAFNSRTLVFWLTECLKGSNEIKVYERKYELSIAHILHDNHSFMWEKSIIRNIYTWWLRIKKKKSSEFWKKNLWSWKEQICVGDAGRRWLSWTILQS